jgi:HEAT repeat protein
MPEFSFSRFDWFSFILGFVATTIFWWLFLRIKRWYPQLKSFLQQRIQTIKEKRRTGIEAYIREDIVFRTQTIHISAPLFALNEILIPPRLVEPLPYSEPGKTNNHIKVCLQAVPYLPDWPELTAEYNPNKIDPLEIIIEPIRVVLVGQPGCGKSITLAYVANKMALKETPQSFPVDLVPIYLHILDIPYQDFQSDPTKLLGSALAQKLPALAKTKLPSFLSTILEQNRAALLIDGIDELPPPELHLAVEWISRLIEKYPQCRLILTGSSDYIDGLIALDFQPFSIASWDHTEKIRFLQQWGDLWINKALPSFSPQGEMLPPSTKHLVTNWLEIEHLYLTPLEITLLVWGAYSGTLKGHSPLEAFRAYFSNINPKIIPQEAISALAFEMCSAKKVCMTYEELDRFFAKYKPVDPNKLPTSSQGNPVPITRKINKKKKISSRDKAISTLLDLGILIEHPGELIRFANPCLTGFLAGYHFSDSLNLEDRSIFYWAPWRSMICFLAAQNRIDNMLVSRIGNETDPLFKETLGISRWLKYSAPDAKWRILILRRLVDLIRDESLPLALRARFLSALVVSNDSSVAAFLKQQLKSSQSILRELAILGLGSSNQFKFVDEMVEAFKDPDTSVREAACIAVGGFKNATSLQALTTALLSGDDQLSQIAAECLSCIKVDGIEILKQALTMDDLLVRRAAITGLAQIHEPWVIETLEKIAVEDGQWVVRNVAGQMLEIIQNEKSNNRFCKPTAQQSSWLIQFASRQGSGLSPDEPATDMLLAALKYGTQEEKLASLEYLRQIPEEKVINSVLMASQSENEALQNTAIIALWQLKLSQLEIEKQSTILTE